MKSNGTVKYRVEQLEKNYEELDKKITVLMENHLPHLNEQMITLQTRITILTGLNLMAIILGVIASKLL